MLRNKNHVHTPHNSDAMQTVCEKCECELFYDSVTDTYDTDLTEDIL